MRLAEEKRKKLAEEQKRAAEKAAAEQKRAAEKAAEKAAKEKEVRRLLYVSFISDINIAIQRKEREEKERKARYVFLSPILSRLSSNLHGL